jgi:hypothetical protein
MPNSTMPTAKDQVRAVLKRLPDDCTMEDVQYELYVAELIRQRLKMTETEKGIPHSEIVRRVESWRKKRPASSGSNGHRKISKKSVNTSARSRQPMPAA